MSSDTESCLYSNLSLQGTCYSARSLIWINSVCLVVFVDTFHLKSIMSNIIPVSAVQGILTNMSLPKMADLGIDLYVM